MKLREHLITSMQNDLIQEIILKFSKFNDKDRILKAATEKRKVTYKVTPITLSADFSIETLYRPLCSRITFSKYRQLKIRGYRQEKDYFI